MFLLKAKGIWKGLWRKVVMNTNYKHVTSYETMIIIVNTSSLFCIILNFCAPQNSYVATLIPNVLDFGGFFLNFYFLY